MALVHKNRVKETSTTTGTGTYTLAGAATGFQSFSAIGDGNTCYYTAEDGTDWEVGVGTYTSAGTTLARTTVLASSNAGAAVNWAAGTRNLFVGIAAEKFISIIDLLTTRGDIITRSASVPQRVALGASGLFLKSDGTDAAWSGASDYQAFTGSGTWTKPAGFNANALVVIRAWGAGGGAGRSASANSSGGGGGGMYVERKCLLSAMGSTETITIGAAGIGKITSAGNGAAGGNTTVGSLVTAYGGGGGGDGASSHGGGAGIDGWSAAGPTATGKRYISGSGASQHGGIAGASSGELSVAGTTTPINPWFGGSGAGKDANFDACNPGQAMAAGGSFMGGGGGGNQANVTGGVSVLGGNGGAGHATVPVAGTAPGGGGGAGGAAVNGANGALGRVEIWVIG